METTKFGSFDRASELRAFNETKTGVKGLVNAGITHLPRIFHESPSNLANPKPPSTDLLHLTTIPTIDFGGRVFEDEAKRKNTVDGVRDAAEKWGVLPAEISGESLCIQVTSISTLHQLQAGETLSLVTWLQILPNHEICQRFGCYVGVHKASGESRGVSMLRMLCHYYPPCPKPDLTLGASKHSDSSFLTVLLSNQIEGLQVLREGYWFDVPPAPGALIINLGDLLQAKPKELESSVACFFTTGIRPNPRTYGPIRELVSEDNPPKYREITVKEFAAHRSAKGHDGTSDLLHFRI
ncbi:hypothetical protein F2Q69_00025957 [Brassica cretica]|uniref:Fe2OG dioxygenase domain-containing protein n=1 Tax=Brassica cretica TaxID=69181 RepID=A0A8S9S7X5_BRACR|nr:hypothetical protein F2Q69_00025957 [Brassica cretica]